MAQRDLCIAAYDISDDRRLRQALRLSRAYAIGGQKSVHEVFLSPAERVHLLSDMTQVIDPTSDRFLLLRLDPRATVLTAGRGVAPEDPDYFYFG